MKEAVHDGHGEEERLLEQLEAAVHFNEPVDEDGAHRRLDLVPVHVRHPDRRLGLPKEIRSDDVRIRPKSQTQAPEFRRFVSSPSVLRGCQLINRLKRSLY